MYWAIAFSIRIKSFQCFTSTWETAPCDKSLMVLLFKGLGLLLLFFPTKR